MKKFLCNLGKFVIPLLVLVLLWFPYYYITSLIVKSKLKVISGYGTLIMGDSQMQRINPGYFTDSTYNFASSGEHYYFTLQKIKKITSFEHCNVRQIILGVSAHSFGVVYNKLFDVQFPEGLNSLKRYFYYFSGNEFLGYNSIPGLSVMRNIAAAHPDWGGYFYSKYSDPDTSIINKNLFKHFEGVSDRYCSSQVKYLKEIIDLCSVKNIQIILISTPYHPYYLKKVNNYYKNILKQTIKETGDANYISYLGDKINAGLMSDGIHLNAEGSAVYSKMINDTIHAQVFINELINK